MASGERHGLCLESSRRASWRNQQMTYTGIRPEWEGCFHLGMYLRC